MTSEQTGIITERASADLAVAYGYEIDQARWLWHGLGLADLAHALELVEVDAVPRDAGARLIAGILELADQPPAELGLDPAYGDLFSNRERLLDNRIGESAGWLRLGRTRREALRVALRLSLAELLRQTLDASVAAQEALLSLASSHVDTVMPDYTYLQVAEPTVLGHYLGATLETMARSAGRLQSCYSAINLSPAGVGAVSGPGVRLSRRRLADRLGFDGPIEHTRDAMWQTDVLVELAAVVAIAAQDASRLAEDWEVWASAEFGFLRLDASHTRSSVLMPQKRNPYPLVFLRGAASVLAGRMVGMATLARTMSAQTDNYVFAATELPYGVELLRDSLRLLAGVAGTATIQAETMADRAAASAGYATAVAEAISKGLEIDYRTAHGMVSRALESSGDQSGDKLLMELRRLARAELQMSLTLTPAQFAKLRDPVWRATSQTVLGGSGKAALLKMLRRYERGLEKQRGFIRRAAGKAEEAEKALLAAGRREAQPDAPRVSSD